MATKNRIKAQAAAYAPQTREDCIADIKKLGDAQRDLTRRQADMNDEIAEITKRHSPRLETLNDQVTTLQHGIQTWCEAHRDALTDGGKVKTANLITGEVQWRQRPPSCRVRNEDGVIETLERLDLGRFVRVKKEVNKEALLQEPDAAPIRSTGAFWRLDGCRVVVGASFEEERGAARWNGSGRSAAARA